MSEEARAPIEYSVAQHGDGWRYDILNGPLGLYGFRPTKPAAIDAGREDMRLARLFS